MKRILLLNFKPAICSIYMMGTMVRDIIGCDYLELSEGDEIPRDYDIYVFNYHYIQTPWIRGEHVKNLPGLKAALLVEVLPEDTFVVTPGWFNRYLCLDPTVRERPPLLWTLPRPLSVIRKPKPIDGIKIGVASLGIGAEGKCVGDVVRAVSLEFGSATIRLHAPKSTVDIRFGNNWNVLRDTTFPEGITLERNDRAFTHEELIDWCGENTINVYFYHRPKMCGIAQAPDQAIMSGRPVAINADPTFRHIHEYQPYYPKWLLSDSIERGEETVARMQEAWSPEKFRRAFYRSLSLE